MERKLERKRKALDEHRKEVKKALSEQEKVGKSNSWTWTIFKFLVISILVLTILNYSSLKQEYAKLRPEDGKLHDIGFGHNLFIYCQGHGKPVVVLDAPAGETFDTWTLIQREVAKHTKNASALNQANSSVVHGTEKMVDDLRRLLSTAKVSLKPLIYVGAEMGAINGRYYSSLNFPEVAHLVLVNPLTENFLSINERVWELFWYSHLVPSIQKAQLLSAIGFTRVGYKLYLKKDALEDENVDEMVKLRHKYLSCSPGHQSTKLEEYLLLNASLIRLKNFLLHEPIPDTMPVTVIASDQFDRNISSELNQVWQNLITELTDKIHPQSRRVKIADGDRKDIYYKGAPTISKVIIQAIKQYRKSRVMKST
ncbi:uncharacterized protein TRIADDRAFT_58929 [Trichoplax adhaerens]|uniref:AB hydrolase-1 domain-containing protein n=1 Tax=Trichoplax adhaerens TaxID=10228 RepID=B3S425_TRIAD|nr:hypothetical protein TRIADDRAFT_58929 [Trichoplax adhaerens]EDV22566.1 hypothetical protein TRIADDRAFT_58929 [Trichoplax adhaerens]|eukprot:XP_002115110.1 hypothetical protein TRIADDRAFT_58929 [Trichoplax adhaerens]